MNAELRIDYMQLEFLHIKLRKLMHWVANNEDIKLPDGGVITSLYRIDDSGVHGTLPVRGCDLRCRDAKWGAQIVQTINRAWTYDPDRPHLKCAMYHDVGMGAHIHLQVHPATAIPGTEFPV